MTLSFNKIMLLCGSELGYGAALTSILFTLHFHHSLENIFFLGIQSTISLSLILEVKLGPYNLSV